MSSTIVKKISINASAEKVWEVLTKPEFIRQWDDVPDSFEASTLMDGSILEWEGYSRLTVTRFEPTTHLRMALFLPKLDLPAHAYDISYDYQLAAEGDGTALTITIGDFSTVPNTEDYLEASEEFAEKASGKIKELAETV